MAICRGLNAGYGSVGLFGATHLPSWRERPAGLPTEIARFEPLHQDRSLFKNRPSGIAIRLRRSHVFPFPHGSFS
jgi:hypothetical protein